MDVLDDYYYHLPPELIAQRALRKKDNSKLLVLKENIEHRHFYDLVDYLEKGDILVINKTKVKKCRLIGKKESGSPAEITLIKKIKSLHYLCKIKTRNPHPGINLIFKKGLIASVISENNDLFYVKFNQKINPQELELLTPPYIKGKIAEKDYQTIYAKKESSLAAPTAGLHFTPELIAKIKKKGIKIAEIQLDISYATFLPVIDINKHDTGEEYFSVDQKNADIINSGNIVAVGTTVIKCLESCQWKNGQILPSSGISNIFIKPGHKFKTSFKKVITNFHLPKSSLLLLISAYIGKEKLLQAYREAVTKKYRFFSLGDAMLIIKK